MKGLAAWMVFPAAALVATALSEEALADDARRAYQCAVGVRVPEAQLKDTSDRRRRRQQKFSAMEILDLELLARVPQSKAGSKVHLKLYTPRGHVYQVISLSVPPPDPTPLRRRRSRGAIVRASLPVAGTTIVNSSLYGEWTIEAYLDDDQEALLSQAELRHRSVTAAWSNSRFETMPTTSTAQ